MQRILILMFGLLIPLNVSFAGQGLIRPSSKLVQRYERGCDDACLQELAIQLGGVYAKGSDDKVVVRFCSKEPLPVAFSTAAAPPKFVASVLTESYGFTSERILFSRSEDCLGIDPSITATEFWVIPKGGASPPSVEMVNASQIKIDNLGMKGAFGTAKSYRKALQKLPQVLRTRPKSVGIVLGYYYNKPSTTMERRLREVRRRLKQSGAPNSRYFIRQMPWTGERSVDPPDPEPTYPSIFIIEILKN